MKTKEEIKDFVNKFMKSYGPDTFIPNQHGVYVYHSENGASGLNLKVFFEELLNDYIESELAQLQEGVESGRK